MIICSVKRACSSAKIISAVAATNTLETVRAITLFFASLHPKPAVNVVKEQSLLPCLTLTHTQALCPGEVGSCYTGSCATKTPASVNWNLPVFHLSCGLALLWQPGGRASCHGVLGPAVRGAAGFLLPTLSPKFFKPFFFFQSISRPDLKVEVWRNGWSDAVTAVRISFTQIATSHALHSGHKLSSADTAVLPPKHKSVHQAEILMCTLQKSPQSLFLLSALCGLALVINKIAYPCLSFADA